MTIRNLRTAAAVATLTLLAAPVSAGGLVTGGPTSMFDSITRSPSAPSQGHAGDPRGCGLSNLYKLNGEWRCMTPEWKGKIIAFLTKPKPKPKPRPHPTPEVPDVVTPHKPGGGGQTPTTPTGPDTPADHETPAPVPLPAAGWLLGLALAPLVWLRRRRSPEEINRRAYKKHIGQYQ